MCYGLQVLCNKGTRCGRKQAKINVDQMFVSVNWGRVRVVELLSPNPFSIAREKGEQTALPPVGGLAVVIYW